jgi:hypothetical protein
LKIALWIWNIVASPKSWSLSGVLPGENPRIFLPFGSSSIIYIEVCSSISLQAVLQFDYKRKKIFIPPPVLIDPVNEAWLASQRSRWIPVVDSWSWGCVTHLREGAYAAIWLIGGPQTGEWRKKSGFWDLGPYDNQERPISGFNGHHPSDSKYKTCTTNPASADGC